MYYKVKISRYVHSCGFVRFRRNFMKGSVIEESLEDAKKKIAEPDSNILALPRAFTTTAVHLCMKDPLISEGLKPYQIR